MAVTYSSFVTRFPEFTNATQALVEACIAEAELMVDSNYYGDKADMAVNYYAAHLIAINPLGEMARLDKKSEKTIYLIHFEKIKRSSGTGFRVV